MKNILLPLCFILCALNSQAQDLATNSHDSDLYYFSSDTIKTANDTVKRKKSQELQEVIINGKQHQKPVSALRSGIKPMDIPQSLQIIDGVLIEQQQAIRLSEVVKNTNGVYVSSARGGATESLYSRGYDMSANNMFKNGFRYNSGSIPDVSGLEKIEFLKGGSALLFGNVSPGGILNLVTKTPEFTKGGEVAMQMGSNAYYKPSLDFYGPLNNSIAYRINGSYENSESYRDVVKNERFYVNPSLLFHINDKSQITLQGDYLDADWTPDFGTGAITTPTTSYIVEVPRQNFYGALWSRGNTKSSSASVFLNHDFNKNWKLNFNSSLQNYNRTSKSTAQLSNVKPDGEWTRTLTENKNLEKILGEQLSLQGTFNTGAVKHQIFTGTDWEYSFASAYTYAFNPTIYDTINLYNFDPSTQRNDEPIARITQITETDVYRFGVYFQDLLSITEKFKVLAGIRWSWQQTEVDTYKEVFNTKTNTQTTPAAATTPTTAPKKLDDAFSPKIGLVYQPTKDVSLFASYSSSFTPNTGTTPDLQPIAPSIIDQYEAGIKKEFFKGMLTTNLTVYQITNDNLAQMAQYKADGSLNTDTTIKTLNGGTKSKGIELDLSARPLDGLSINAGYSYNDMRYTNTSGLNGSTIEGERLVRTPQHTANASFFYTLPSGVLKGTSFGAIANYIGDRFGGWDDLYDNTKPDGINHRKFPVEGYTTIDVSAGYHWKKASLLCKLSNITNELNYTVHENYSINPIAPRQVMLNLKYQL